MAVSLIMHAVTALGILAPLGAGAAPTHWGTSVPISIELPRQVAADQEVVLNATVANRSGSAVQVLDLRRLRPDTAGIIYMPVVGIRPQVIDRGGSLARFAMFRHPDVDDPQSFLMTLQPGGEVRGSAVITRVWGFQDRPGDYAISAPMPRPGPHARPQVAEVSVSNTCFLRVLPKGAAIPSRPPKLALRITAGSRTFVSDQAPISTDRETYVPARAAAALAGAQLTPGFDKVVLARGKDRLVLLPHEGAAVLPGGERVTGIAIPFAHGEEAMVALSLLSQAFAVPKQLSMSIIEQKP